MAGPAGATGATGPAGPASFTNAVLLADFSTTLATAQNIPGLSFTPVAGKRYKFQATLILRSSATNTNPRLGLAWPVADDGVVVVEAAVSGTTSLIAYGGYPTSVLLATGNAPSATASFLGLVEGMLVAGATPSGNLQLQVASRNAGVAVTIRAGSVLSWREV